MENNKNELAKVTKRVKGVMKTENLKRGIIVFASLVIIGGAVYLNYSYFNEEAEPAATENEQVSSVNEENESYFAMTELSRQKNRDEAMEVLQTIVDSDGSTQEDKNIATQSIKNIADNIQSESNIESLVSSKGFEECVAVISEGSATVVVKSDGLLENEITQIQEIVYSESGIKPENLHIIEKAE